MIQRLQDREQQMRDGILEEKLPREASRDTVLAQLRVHNSQLRRIETAMKHLQLERLRVLNGGIQPTLVPFVVANPANQFSAGRVTVGNLSYAEQLRRRNDRLSRDEERKRMSGRDRDASSSYGPTYSWGASLVDDSMSRMRREAELNRIDGELAELRQAAEPVRQQLGAGKVQRQELEGELRGAITPLKRDLDRVRLERQGLQKELQQLSANSRALQESAATDRFHDWRTVSEQDLLRDLQRHWGE